MYKCQAGLKATAVGLGVEVNSANQLHTQVLHAKVVVVLLTVQARHLCNFLV